MIKAANARLFRFFHVLAGSLIAGALLDICVNVVVWRRIPLAEPIVCAIFAVYAITYPSRCISRVLRGTPQYFANPVTVDVTPEEVADTSAVGRISIRWPAVTKVDERVEFWIVRAGRVCVTVPANPSRRKTRRTSGRCS